jgi:hypothetical protein
MLGVAVYRFSLPNACAVPRASIVLASVVVVLMPSMSATAAEQTGEQIYRAQCAKCHGAQGEGVTKDYGKPLAGDRSVTELAQLIGKTMPEDDPGTCLGEDARRVAAYIYDTFYSPVAQARNRPVRLELSRLTVRQFRQSIADLVGSFRFVGPWSAERGLQANYYSSHQLWNKKDHVLERIDPVVEFNFGESSPLAGKIKPEEFSIRWEGGVLAPETGEYEFILRSDNAARLWVNDPTRPLIDGTVHSGKDVELRESIRLLAGRVYPLKLEFVKSQKSKDKVASIGLRWKMPDRVAETIPARNLSPGRFAQVCVVTTPFPPDDRSTGYERGSSISQAWEQATTDAALEVADYVLDHLGELSGARNDGPERTKKIQDFCQRWAQRAFRRPLDDEQKKFFVDRHFKEAPHVEAAVQRVILLTLLSPRFLYQDIDVGRLDAYDVASRLSLGLWDSLPDDKLWQAAASGKLMKSDEVRRQAERMASDLRTSAKLHEFFEQYLRIDHFTDLAKDAKRFPEFDEEIVSDLHTSLDLFLDDVCSSSDSDYRQLLLADWLYLNGRLAKFYEKDLPADAPFQKVTLNADRRAGVLTHPYLMAGFAYTASSSPIHRGVFVARNVLGRSLRMPPMAVAPVPAELRPELTTRQRVAMQTKDNACQSCHRMINPLGFAFENFDAVGRFRDKEQGKPIDATGVYQTRTGESIKFRNVRELARYLADGEETHEAFVEQLFHYLVKQPIRAHGAETLSNLEKSFSDHKFSIRQLVIESMVASALHKDQSNALAKGK